MAPIRRRRGARGVWLVATCVGAGAVAGCGSPSAGKICTAIGAEDGVHVNFAAGVLPTTGSSTVKVCVQLTCTQQTFTQPANTDLFTATETVHKSSPVTVSLQMRRAKKLIFDSRTTATLGKSQPNGPGCDPTVWQAQVTAPTNGRLTSP